MENDEINKLENLDINKYLNDEGFNSVGSLFDEVGMENWVYDETDHTLKLKVKIINNSKNPNPIYQKKGDSGFDLTANLSEDTVIVIEPLKRALIPTGLHFQIPEGFELQVRSRSGLALKNGLMVLNSPGTVDAGYRGEVKVIIFNTDDKPFTIKNGDRIAQGVIAPIQFEKTTKFIQVNKLDESDRGSGGFGSTGYGGTF
jgi:dUTP pyrophosphatase